MDNRHEFATFLSDLHDNQCTVTDFVADNPKRSFAREALTHAGYYACVVSYTHLTLPTTPYV